MKLVLLRSQDFRVEASSMAVMKLAMGLAAGKAPVLQLGDI